MTIGTAKRAPTFQINVAVTNFAPERIVSDKRGSAASKCICIETYTWHSRQFRYRGRKTKPQMTSNKKMGGVGRLEAGRSQGVIALLGGSRFSRSVGRTFRGVDVSRYSKGL